MTFDDEPIDSSKPIIPDESEEEAPPPKKAAAKPAAKAAPAAEESDDEDEEDGVYALCYEYLCKLCNLHVMNYKGT